jgi:hypothetical protein
MGTPPGSCRTVTKRTLLFGLSLLACCLITNRATTWLVRDEQRVDFHEAVDFVRYRDAFEAFLATHPLKDGEQVRNDQLPPSVADLGVLNVYRNGKFVYFVVRASQFIGDQWIEEFIRQLEGDEAGIKTILSTTKRTTYHIQCLYSAPGWYFWLHD